MSIDIEIGKRIKARREELKLSQRALAEKMGYSHHSTVARIEAGTVDIPQSRIARFAEVLGVPVSYLMGWEEVQKKNDTLSDIVIKLRTDEELFAVVDSICRLDSEKLIAVKSVVSALLK